MKKLSLTNKVLVFMFGMFLFATSCDDKLNEMNINPYGIVPETVNPNLLMTTVLGDAAKNYADLGVNNLAGAVQHTQKNGWYTGHNVYSWANQNWTHWYDILRTNELMMKRGADLENNYFQGVGLTMKSFIFGNITDLWGDAPYTDALKGDQGGLEFQYPKFDSQEVIYDGIIADLQQAAQLFASATTDGVTAANDLYFRGDIDSWRRFTNSLLLRYYLRISNKKPDVAKAGIEAIYNSGLYISSPAEDAVLDYTGGASDVWITRHIRLNPDDFQRFQACQTFIDQLMDTNDPRLTTWFAPVRVQWVADASLSTATENFIRRNGEPESVVTHTFDEFLEDFPNDKFTRHFNPNMVTYNTDLYVGLPAGIDIPESHNGNPAPGQGTQNQHVSQLADIYATPGVAGDILKARLISATEVSFILAEAALKGWAVGDAASHYNNAIRHSLATWEVEDDYEEFIGQPEVAFNNTIEQVITQKWVASWTAAAESFADYRRTGFPKLQAGPLSQQPRLALRYQYGNDEYNNNGESIKGALDRLELTEFSGSFGKDSQWSKSWLYQGTGSPW